MSRCEYASDGKCSKYNLAKKNELINQGRTSSFDLGSLTLTRTDMKPICRNEGLPCYKPNHKNDPCFKKMLNTGVKK